VNGAERTLIDHVDESHHTEPEPARTSVPRWRNETARDHGDAVTVLVVDADQRSQQTLGVRLRAKSYRVLTASDGATALRLAVDRKPDLVVLDLDLPDIDGADVIAGLRGWSTLPIIVVSARADCEDKIKALDAGADDYVTKPFVMAELLARVRVVVRRLTASPNSSGEAAVETDSFTVDLVTKTVLKDGTLVHLTRHEWAILEVLVRNPGRLVSQQQLLMEVWGPEHLSASNYLRVYLGQLRRKLERIPSSPRHLLTEPGMGYRFER
jgi:two-component system KDP operon response regulator KdpE